MMDVRWKFFGLDIIIFFLVVYFFVLVNIYLVVLGGRISDYNFVLNKGGDKYCNYIKNK